MSHSYLYSLHWTSALSLPVIALALHQRNTIHMNHRSTTTNSEDIEFRIRVWIKNNPNREEAGQRMLVQLERIRTEFSGDTAARLEALVGETLERQIRIDASRAAGLAAARKLSESVRRLTESMSLCLATAEKAHNAIARTSNAISEHTKTSQTSSQTPRTFTFAPLKKRSDDKLMN